MELINWITANWMILLGAGVSIAYIIVTVTPTKKDDTVFWKYYSKLKAVLPTLPNFKKDD